MPCGENKNPLQRGGTSQRERSLAGLNPGYARVDEHDYQDWIFFANEFAGFLNYFNQSDEKAGDWKAFFSSDVSSQLGSVAVQDIEQYRQAIKARFDFLKDDSNKTDGPGLEKNLNDLFSALLTLSKAIDEYFLQLPDTLTLKNTLLNLVQSKLSLVLYRLLGYFKAAKTTLNFLDEGFTHDWRIFNKRVEEAASVVGGEGLSPNWWVVRNGSALLNFEWLRRNAASVNNGVVLFDAVKDWHWSDYVASIGADDSIFTSALADSAAGLEKEYLQIQHAANHNLFSGIFDQYLSAYAKIITDATAELQTTLTDWSSHQPHFALFLSFLKLFKFAQQQANTITRRHLDFYYKEVLRLKPKDAVPNKAHVLVELAKQIDAYLLVKGTQLKAGKDSTGKEVLYALDRDTTFNKAKVVSLRSVYFGKEEDDIKDFTVSPPQTVQNNTGRLFASPVANSSDGLGAELKSPNKEWHPYVNKEFKEGLLTKVAAPKADIGFALASHYLALAEGERKVVVKMVTSDNAAFTGKHFDCYLTTEKGWYKVETLSISTSTLTASSTQCAQIQFTLAGDQPAMINYNAAIHGGSFGVAVPILKIVLQQSDLSLYEYIQLKNVTVSMVEIRIEVGMDSTPSKKGIKQLDLANDFGPLDAAKPFMPFGANPLKDSGFVIGSKEIFSKKNLDVKANIEWANFPTTQANIDYDRQYNASLNTSTNTITYSPASEGTFAPKVYVEYITAGVWNRLPTPIDAFLTSTTTISSLVPSTVPVSFFEDYNAVHTPFNSKTNKGFIRLVLERDFGHKAYLSDLTRYLIEQASPTLPKTIPVKPEEPYTPIVQSLYLSYSAYQSADLTSTNKANFDTREIRFFHLYPFGEAEQHNYINTSNGLSGPVFLLPQFNHKAGSETKQHIGEFYIGIENLQANSAVNILFQVLEGTSDPLVAKPEKHIAWSYLSNNIWVDFAEQEISDATLALLQSGIISFAIPPKATINNTVLHPGKIWIRAAIESAAEAIPKLISVDAQAAVSTFQPANNADDFLEKPLPAGTISKLKTPDAAVKKIAQPYNSFGGRPKESEEHFYLRVSERLRHKARAITIWDYEHLILEAFPEIYKVKCLNHTGVIQFNGEERINEMKPGCVLIITIPALNNRNDVNPLQPYTSQNLLTRIKKFLDEKVSCFVTVEARQPLFEEIGVSFQLKLYEQYKDFTFYANKLKEEIVQYLTPWAGNSEADIQFGGNVYKSSLINFIEERYYVDFITDVVLSHKIGNTATADGSIEEITASTARSILVSVPASKHNITPYATTASLQAVECEGVSVHER